jgi:histidyl-tRNA synthetase
MPVYQTPRGTSDRLPADQPAWRCLTEAAERVATRAGYRPIETPVFEDTGVFERGVGADTDVVAKEMYTFADKGGASLTLRPEGTAPVCRAYIQHGMASLPQPVRLFYVMSFFRYDRPQAGRYRQFHQFGAEAIGEIDPAVDAEMIGLLLDFYREAGLRELDLRLNTIGHPAPDCRPRYLEALRAYYTAHAEALCGDCRGRLGRNPLRLLDCKKPTCQPFAAGAPPSADYVCAECAAHFRALQDDLTAQGIAFRLDHRLVRGLDYYTKTVFEVEPPDVGGQSALGGGGRYDGLMEQLGGPPTPGIGFATGLERVLLNLKKQGVDLPEPLGPAVYVAHVGAAAKRRAAVLARELRRNGIAATLAVGDRRLRAQLKQADTFGARWAVILGDDELAREVAKIHDLAGGGEREVPLAALGNELSADA